MAYTGNPRRRNALADALSGVAASLVSLWTFYPFDMYKTNVQANNKCSDGLYRGLGVKTLHTASSSFCYFYIYSWISKGKHYSTLKRLILSAIAAMLNTCLTLPLDVLSAKQQTATKPKRQETSETNNSEAAGENDEVASIDLHEDEKKDDIHPPETAHHAQTTASTLSKETQTLTHLWKGLYPSLLLCSNPSIHYTVFDSIKSQILQPDEKNLTMAQAFFVGLFAKFVATMATYPLIRTKILLMVTSQKGMVQCLSREYQQSGIRGWYRGCHLQLLHTLLKTALLMMVRERIAETTRRLLVPNDNN